MALTIAYLTYKRIMDDLAEYGASQRRIQEVKDEIDAGIWDNYVPGDQSTLPY